MYLCCLYLTTLGKSRTNAAACCLPQLQLHCYVHSLDADWSQGHCFCLKLVCWSSLCNTACIMVRFYDTFCTPMAESFFCLCKLMLQGLHIVWVLRSQQRTQAQPSHKPAQHHLRALLLSLHCTGNRTNRKLMCCSSPGRKQTTPLQHHA